jgi:hypothetical protein
MGHDNPTNEPSANSPRSLPNMFKLTIFVHKLQQMRKIKIIAVAKAISKFNRQEIMKVTPNAIF